MYNLENAWNIPTLNLLESDNATIFNTQNVYHARDAIKSLAINGNPLASLITFKPQRLLLHELIVEFSLQVPFSTEEEFQQCVISQYLATLVAFKDQLEQLANIDYKSDKIQNVNELKEFQKIYLSKVVPTIYEIASLIIKNYLCEKNITPISIPEPAKRITAMVAGGQASGKGSSVSILKRELEQNGIHWKNVVKINTDSYKPLVLEPGTVDKFHYSQLAQTEASIIHQKLFSRLNLLAESNKAPHVMIDQVFVGEDKLKYSLFNNGQAVVAIVSTEVITAIERAFQRGMDAKPPEHGRFEDTKNILSCHKSFAEQLPSTLAKFIDTNTKVEIIDNNASSGTAPDCAAMIYLGKEDKRIVILNKECMKSFIKKLHINVDAKNSSQVYSPQLIIQDDDINKFLSPISITVQENVSTGDTRPRLSASK